MKTESKNTLAEEMVIAAFIEGQVKEIIDTAINHHGLIKTRADALGDITNDAFAYTLDCDEYIKDARTDGKNPVNWEFIEDFICEYEMSEYSSLKNFIARNKERLGGE